MIGELAVLLLRQRRLEAAQAGFDVRYRNREPRGCKRCCQRRVDVAGDDDEIGAVLLEYPFAADQRTSQLLGVAAGADAHDDVRLRQVEVAEKGVRHFAVVVLPRMDETAHDRGLETVERVDHGCRLDEVRPGSDDEADRGTAHHELADRVRQGFGGPDQMEPAKAVFGERDQWSGDASIVGRGNTSCLDVRERREQRGNLRRCERRSPGALEVERDRVADREPRPAAKKRIAGPYGQGKPGPDGHRASPASRRLGGAHVAVRRSPPADVGCGAAHPRSRQDRSFHRETRVVRRRPLRRALRELRDEASGGSARRRAR